MSAAGAKALVLRSVGAFRPMATTSYRRTRKGHCTRRTAHDARVPRWPQSRLPHPMMCRGAQRHGSVAIGPNTPLESITLNERPYHE